MKKLKNIEVELKFPLLNKKYLARKLNKIAKKTKSEYQKDTYFSPYHKNFLEQDPIEDWLRIRESKKGTSVNFKHWYSLKDGTSTHCNEFETVVENANSLKKIFQSLDLREIIIVEKTRITWEYKKCEIAIDQVTNLGTFLEIEAKGNFKDIDSARKHLYKVLKDLGAEIGEQDYKGYPYLLIEKI